MGILGDDEAFVQTVDRQHLKQSGDFALPCVRVCQAAAHLDRADNLAALAHQCAQLAVGVGGTFAASNPATLYACFDVYGNVRVSDKAMCQLPGGGRLASWGTAAVPGPVGATGPTGPIGPTGAAIKNPITNPFSKKYMPPS